MTLSVYKNHLFYTHQTTQVLQDSTPNSVLIGVVGTGKSTFFNKTTNKNQKISDGEFSTTRVSASSNSAYGRSFNIIDTPGTSAEEDKIGHALCLHSALIEGPINRIFLLVQHQKRFGALQKNLQEQMKLLFEWRHLITVVISHWDREVTEENIKLFEDTKNYLIKNVPSLPNSFIFVGQDSDPEELCDAVYKSLCQNAPVQIKIDEKQFRYNFDLFKNMFDYITEYQKIFDSTSNFFLEEIARYQDSDKDEFLHACIVDISSIAEDILQDFQDKYGNDMVEVDSYLHYLELKQYFIPIVEKVRKFASLKMSYSLLNPQAPQNLLKQCSNCGLIWLKVDGCDNTTCGNRQLQKDYYQGGKLFMKFSFDWRKLQWKKSTESIAQKQGTYDKKTKGIGCGQPLNWVTAPPISLECLKMLNDAGISDLLADQSKKMEQQSQSFQENLIKKNENSKVQHI
ncbi:hypothetical protein ABPG74_018955 [Tetrahymena malaccensis]